MSQTLTLDTFQSALATMNQSIEHNQDALFFKTLLKGCQSVLHGENLGVAIYKDDPSSPHDYYTVQMKDGRLMLVDHGKQDTDVDWSVSEDYLKDLADHPNKYVNNPEKLSLKWLADRITGATA